jgi:hypothetical protein
VNCDAAGSIVTINDDLDDDEQPPWVHAVTDLRARYLGNDHTAATAPYTNAPVSHREILASSPFATVEALTWTWERRLTIEEAVGLVPCQGKGREFEPRLPLHSVI